MWGGAWERGRRRRRAFGAALRPPRGTYQQALDGEVLQASVPRRVKDHGQRPVRGLRVADLHLVLHGERGREAVTRAAWVPTPSAGIRAAEPSALSPRGVKGKCTGVIQPQKRGSGKAELTVLYVNPRSEESTRVPITLAPGGCQGPTVYQPQALSSRGHPRAGCPAPSARRGWEGGEGPGDTEGLPAQPGWRRGDSLNRLCRGTGDSTQRSVVS